MPTGVATAVVLGGVAAGASIMQGRAASKQAEYQADVAEAQGRAESAAIEAESRRLADEQRETKAQQRVVAAQTGGGLSAGQNILALAEEASKMQMDQLELQRQSGIATQGAQTQASLLRAQGKQAKKASYLDAISSGAGAYYGARG
jgi:hypothetical protein